MTKLIPRPPYQTNTSFQGWVNPMTKSLVPSSGESQPAIAPSPISSFCWLLSCSSPVSCHHRLRQKWTHFFVVHWWCGMPAIAFQNLWQLQNSLGMSSCIPKTIQVCISRRKNVPELLWLFAHSVNMNSYQCGHTPEANNRFKDLTWKKCIHFMSKFQIYYQFTFRCNPGCPCPPPLIHQWTEHPRPLHLQHLPRKKKKQVVLPSLLENTIVLIFPKSVPGLQPLNLSALFFGLQGGAGIHSQDTQHSGDSRFQTDLV